MIILAVDPGSAKCGIAVLDYEKVYYKGIVLRTSLVLSTKKIMGLYKIDEIVVGSGTGGPKIMEEFSIFTVPVKEAAEDFSTLEARKLYFKENPPKGIFCFLPVSLLFPSRPIDDYAAVLLGRRYLKG